MDKLRQHALELWNRWQALSLSRKLTWGAGGLFCAATVALLWWVSQPDYRILYERLSAEDAGVITGKLQSKGVPFKLAAGGTTILVPTDQAMQVHLDLTAEGIPGTSKVGKGLDLFDQPMLSATPFNQHVNFVRAQQGELARTIMQIEPIVYARVHIVRPEPSPFIREQKPTTASVMVKLRHGATLNRNTVGSIAAIVAGGVEGLAKENVRIVESSGRLLSEDRDPDTGMIGSFLEKHKEVEQHLAREAERILAHVLGPGKAIVRVTAELNTKQIKERRETLSAEGRVATTEKSTLNKTNSSTSTKGGPAGSSSNMGKPGGSSGSGSGGSSTLETQESRYDYPRTVIEWQNKNGSIERLTVAAFVDFSAFKDSEQSIDLKDIQEIIKKAVGFKADRDEIQVTQVRMPTVNSEAFDNELAAHVHWQTILTIVRYVSIVMVALCACPIVWVLARRLTRTVPMPVDQAQAPKVLRITEELDRNPEALAKILSSWIDRSEAAERKAA